MQNLDCFPQGTPLAGSVLALEQNKDTWGRSRFSGKGVSPFDAPFLLERSPLPPSYCLIHLWLMPLETPKERVWEVLAWGSGTEQMRALDLGGG